MRFKRAHHMFFHLRLPCCVFIDPYDTDNKCAIRPQFCTSCFFGALKDVPNAKKTKGDHLTNYLQNHKKERYPVQRKHNWTYKKRGGNMKQRKLNRESVNNLSGSYSGCSGDDFKT